MWEEGLWNCHSQEIGEGDQKVGGWIVWQNVGVVGRDVYDRECWRKMVSTTATPHGSGSNSTYSRSRTLGIFQLSLWAPCTLQATTTRRGLEGATCNTEHSCF